MIKIRQYDSNDREHSRIVEGIRSGGVWVLNVSVVVFVLIQGQGFERKGKFEEGGGNSRPVFTFANFDEIFDVHRLCTHLWVIPQKLCGKKRQKSAKGRQGGVLEDDVTA